jgi:hypothetical protein
LYDGKADGKFNRKFNRIPHVQVQGVRLVRNRVRLGSLESFLLKNHNATIMNGAWQGDLCTNGVEKELHRTADGPLAHNSNQH